MQPGPPRRRRARPVADAPVDLLLERLEDLAKGWLLALLEHAPLDDMPAILAGDFAREGPRLCDAVVRALADDGDLRRLEPGGALELLASGAGRLAGARDTAGTARAVDALGETVWGGLRAALPNPDPDQIAELAERLTLVIGLVRSAALSGDAGDAGEGGARSEQAGEQAYPGEPPSGPEPQGFGASRRPHVVSVPPVEPPRTDPPPMPSAGATDRQALWVGAFEEELVRAERSGAQLSLLLAELEDADRVLAVEPPGEASATFGRFAQAVRDAVRRQDILACESDSRAWVIARDTGRPGAQALADRIAETVRAGRQWRGAPLSVTLGVAVLGEDGRDSATLIEVAEEARFAAAASGVPSLPAGPRPDNSG